MTKSRKMFYKNLQYLEDLLFVEGMDSFDTRSRTQSIYGKVDGSNKSIAPLSRSALSQIPGTDLQALNFVVDALVDFTSDYQRLRHPVEGISEIVPKRAYVNPLELYDRQLEMLFTSIYARKVEPQKENIRTFDQYVDIVLAAIQEYAEQVPIVYSSFVRSPLCPQRSSGLIVDLLNESHSTDGIPVKMSMIESPSFGAYVEIANKHGFTPMKHAPWSLVANIYSAEMIEYASQYFGNDVNIQNSFYYNCRGFDLDKIREYVGRYYAILRGAHSEIVSYKVCKDGSLREKITSIPRKATTPAIAEYGEKKWFQLYIKIRMAEEKVTIPETKLDRLLENCYSLFVKEGFERAMDYADRKILERKTDIYR